MSSRAVTWSIIFSALLLLLYLFHGLSRGADPDEFQSLLNATLANHHRQLYVDFWDNHGPLLTWMLQPLLAWWHGGYEIIYAFRILMWINTVAMVGLIVTLVAVISPHHRGPRWIAAAMLLASPPFLAKSLELRPDNPANLAATSALLFLVWGLQTRRRILFLICGVSVGIMAAFTIKATLTVAALTAFLLGYGRATRGLPARGAWFRCEAVKSVGQFLLGLSLPLLAMLGALAVTGSADAFFDCYLASNFTRPFPGFTSSELTSITKHAPFWSLVALVVLGVSTFRAITGKSSPVEAGLTMMTWCYLLIFVLVLPTKYYQSLLPMYAPLAAVSGLILYDFLNKRALYRVAGTRAVLAATMGAIVSLLLLLDLHSFNNFKNQKLRRQVAFANRASKIIPPDGSIFDPSGRLFLASREGRYPVLVKFLRDSHRSGKMNLQIPQMLELHRVTAVVLDQRTESLRPEDLVYILDHFQTELEGPQCALLTRRSGREKGPDLRPEP